MKFKITISAIFIAVLLIGIIPQMAYASDWGEGDTIESALSKLKVGFDSNRLDWLVLPNFGTVQKRYTYFYY